MSRQNLSTLPYFFSRDARPVVIKETRLQYLERTVAEHGQTDECLLWPFARHCKPYRYVWVPEFAAVISVHRLSFFLCHARWPEPQALHRCDVTMCYAWAHLFEGTISDNMQNMMAKGRRKQPLVVGEMNGRAKLTEDNVRDIRSRYIKGHSRYQRGNALALAEEYGVNRSVIIGIVLRKFWKQVK